MNWYGIELFYIWLFVYKVIDILLNLIYCDVVYLFFYI